MANTIIVYHKSCLDGACAAGVCYMHFGNTATYIPMQYGEDWTLEIPQHLFDDPVPPNVILVDFSLPPEELTALSKLCNMVLVLDHHQTAVEKLLGGKFPSNVYLNLDVAHSGAYLAWMQFFGDKTVPELVLMTEDRDLWQFKLKDTKAVMAAMQLVGYAPKTWASHIEHAHPQSLAAIGAAILQYQQTIIDRAVSGMMRCKIANSTYNLLSVNCPTLQSEIGDAITTKFPDEVACVYYDDLPGNQTILSFRSKNGKAIEVAKFFGGGGHPNAAGARIPMGMIQRM